MFGSLKKKLKDVIKKVSKDVDEELKEKEQLELKTEAEEEKVEESEAKEEDKLEPSVPVTSKEIKEEKLAPLVTSKTEVPKEPRTAGSLFGKLVRKVKVKTLSEKEVGSILKEMKKALLENDVAYPVAEQICTELKNDLVRKEFKREKTENIIKESLKNAMLDVMSQETFNIEDEVNKKKPFLIIFLGFNGTGKTTTIAKMAHKLKKRYRVVLAAADTFRAASIEQLDEHGKRLGINVIKHKYGSDSAAVIFDAVKHAKAHGIDVVLADTAGRSHANINLMDELKKVCRVNKPDMKILVLDSLTGNDIYDQSRLFNDTVGVDGIILTKADVYEKGGAALSAANTIKKPILFMGTGQEYDDLEEFDAGKIVKNLVG